MSEIKFAAAKELIQEKKYNEARTILKTINDPKAEHWLSRLDEIAPEVKSPAQRQRRSRSESSYASPENKEQALYYREENLARTRRQKNRVLRGADRGFELFAISVFGLGAWIYYNYIAAVQMHAGDGQFHGTTVEIVLPTALIGFAAFGALRGIRAMKKARKIR
jgi:hypothetical protein